MANRISLGLSRKCIICNNLICYNDDYGYCKTKPRRFKNITYPSKTIYFHTECYNKEHHLSK